MPDQDVAVAVSLQRWEDLTFLHWPAPPAQVQRLLPPGLWVDTYDGQAWVGVTPFLMRDVRAPGLPAVPHLSTFPEVNLRTYVRTADGTTGLWFFSLDCPRIPVVGALRTIGAPYRWASVEMRSEPGRAAYRSRRRADGARMRAAVIIGAPFQPGPFEDYLTGRWSAFTRRAGLLWRVPVEHEPWPLRTATARADAGDLFEAAGLARPAGRPLAHFSTGVSVRIGPPRPA
ncbi:YqjF family protein [Georgenia sp. AZ-5]|uniref:YqjF family protein n=1 Tax=Georgenia sp. AZ-5 TaxID=3367526 RepID=UPI00375511CF